MHIVPAVFFLEANRFREPPFWRHKNLIPLAEYSGSTEIGVSMGPEEEGDDAEDSDIDDDEDDEEDEEDRTHQHDRRTFEETLTGDIDLISEFTDGLKYQAQFRDQRLLNALEREGGGFLRFARACMEKERKLKSTRTPTLSTWEKSTSSAMFYRARPADQNT
jgi:hypothetical protein